MLFLNKMQVCKFITSFSALVLPFFRVLDRIIAKTPTDQCHALQVFRQFGFKKLRRDRKYRFPALASAKICLQNYSLHTDYNIIIYMLLCFNKKCRNCLRAFTTLRRKRGKHKTSSVDDREKYRAVHHARQIEVELIVDS